MIREGLRTLFARRTSENAVLLFVATLLVVEVNVLAERAPLRMSLSDRLEAELAPETERLLEDLPKETRIVGLLAEGDEDAPALRALLAQLELRGRSVEFVDPDRQKAKYLGLRLEELGGSSREKAALLLVRGEARSLVTLAGPEERRTGSTFRFLERAFVEGAAKLLDAAPKTACFGVGFGEKRLSDTSLRGLSELALVLERQRITTIEVDLENPGSAPHCDSWSVVGPTETLSESAVARLADAHARGAALGLWLDPITDRRSEVRPSGAEPFTEKLGLRVGAAVVVEGARRRRIAPEEGERFFVELRPHPITANVASDLTAARLRVTFTRPIELDATSGGALLLLSSDEATLLRRVDEAAVPIPAGKPLGLGAFADRCAVFGSSSLIDNESLRESEDALRLAEGVFAALHGSRPPPSVPLLPSRPRRELDAAAVDFLTTFALVGWPVTLGLGALTFFAVRRAARLRRRP